MSKDRMLYVRVTEQEFAQAHQAAEEAGTTLSELIRFLLRILSLGLIGRPRPEDLNGAADS